MGALMTQNNKQGINAAKFERYRCDQVWWPVSLTGVVEDYKAHQNSKKKFHVTKK